MKKKLISLMMAASMLALTVTACSSSQTATASTTDAATESAAEGTSADGSALKVAIVSSGASIDDGSFNQTNYEGICDFIEENPDTTVTALQEETGDTTACANMVSDIASDYNVIVCCGFNFAAIGDVVENNPDTYFILVDTTATNSNGDTVEADNLYTMTFTEQEGGFYAGMAAALETKTNKVAVVDAIAYPSNVNYQYGFMSGVYYANKTCGTAAEVVEIASYAGTDLNNENVGGNYIGSFNDEATGKVIGEALINEGCDVIFVAAGNSGNGVFTAIKEATGVYAIGVDVDQYDDGQNGDTNIMLTSALKNMRINVYRQLNAIKDGSFAGENAVLSTSTDSMGYVSEEGRCQLSAETIEKINEAYELVKSGEIVPAGFGTETTPDNFK